MEVSNIPGFEQDLSPPLPTLEQSSVELASEGSSLGQLALGSGEEMTRALPMRRSAGAEQTTEDEPFALVPDEAKDEEIAQHRNSFLRAVSQVRQKVNIGSEEKYIRERLASYLRTNFDSRPFEEIEENIRSIVTSELNRL